MWPKVQIQKYLSSLAIFFSIFVLSVLSPLNSNAQVDSLLYNGRDKYVKKAGNVSFQKGDFFSAIIYYNKYLRKNPDKIEIRYQLAEAYRFSRYYSKAEQVYQEVNDTASTDFPLSLFYLAKMQQMNGKYKEAKSNFEKFKSTYKGENSSLFKKHCGLFIESCDSAIVFKNNPIEIEQQHLDTSINKAHVDFAPRPLNDSIVLYSSLRSDTISYVNANDTILNEPVRKFYLAKKVNDKNWEFVEEYKEGPFNQEESHNGDGAFNLDSSKFFFSRGKRDRKGILTFQLFVSSKLDSGWSEPTKLDKPINLPKYHSAMPTIGLNTDKDEEVLYFVSNRPGGIGGKDIWFAQWDTQKNSWGEPKNAGKGINTPLNEQSPSYYEKNKTLYFASEGWPGMGGYDVFSSKGELKEWTQPKNFGYPLNTNVDELYFAMAPGDEDGYFISNRKGGVSLKNPTCCYDIYHWNNLKELIFAIEGGVYETITREGKADSLGFVDSGSLSLFKIVDSNEVFLSDQKTNEIGEYFFDLKEETDYVLKASGDYNFTESYSFTTKDLKRSDTLVKDFFLRNMGVGPLVVKNIFYVYDMAYLTPDSKLNIDTTLLRILNNNPDIIVEIGSHTDSRGSHAYNRKLSQRRAQAVLNYLAKKGISRKRMKAKGYGENNPVAANDNPDGSDNVPGRAKNRRTEFKVVGKIKGVSEIKYEQNEPTDSYDKANNKDYDK